MSKQITMPERQDEPTQADVDKMDVTECALAIRAKLDDYKRRHGLAQNAGLGMMLLARAFALLTERPEAPTDITSGIKGDEYVRLMNAVQSIYYAGFWTCDRPVDAKALFTELRDAAGFEVGGSASIPPSDYGVFVVHAKHAATVKATIDYLQQTDPV